MQPVGLRTLNACPDCARQYDVSYLSADAPVRCQCGRLFQARFHAPLSPRALRCSSCGAHLEADAPACRTCSAQTSLSDRGFSVLCPGCWTRLWSEARYCCSCGLQIQPQALLALPVSSRCPGCKGTLRQRDVGQLSLVECSSCAGVWLTAALLEELCRRADRPHPELLAALDRRRGQGLANERPVVYRPCPVCGSLMSRRRFSGEARIVLDWCGNHGLWLDHGELEGILAVVRTHGGRELKFPGRQAEPEGPKPATRPSVGRRRPTRSALSEAVLPLFEILAELASALLGRRS